LTYGEQTSKEVSVSVAATDGVSQCPLGEANIDTPCQ